MCRAFVSLLLNWGDLFVIAVAINILLLRSLQMGNLSAIDEPAINERTGNHTH